MTKLASKDVPQEVDLETPPFNTLARQPLFHIPVKILGLRTSALIDSGASDNFISSKLVRMIACPIHKLKQNFSVYLGDGSPMVVDSFVRIRVSLGTLVLRMCLRVLDMSPELVLGYPFLATFQPQIDWKLRKMTLKVRDRTHVITSVRSCNLLQLLELFPDVFQAPTKCPYHTSPTSSPPVCPHLNTSASAPTVNIAVAPLSENSESPLPPTFPNFHYNSVATLVLHSDQPLPMHIVATPIPSSSAQALSFPVSSLCNPSPLYPTESLNTTSTSSAQERQPSSDNLQDPVEIPLEDRLDTRMGVR